MTEEQAIRIIKLFRKDWDGNSKTAGAEALDMAISALEKQINGGWIPCSERLPEDREIVLVTVFWHETYQVMTASYFGEGLWWCVPWNNCGEHMQKLNPIAWQPLTEPYKAN